MYASGYMLEKSKDCIDYEVRKRNQAVCKKTSGDADV